MVLKIEDAINDVDGIKRIGSLTELTMFGNKADKHLEKTVWQLEQLERIGDQHVMCNHN